MTAEDRETFLVWDASALHHAAKADRLDVLGDLAQGPELVSETLLSIEESIHCAERARRTVTETVQNHNMELALSKAVERLRATRTELFQLGYFGGDQQRLV